ncbi:MAG: FAD-dependent oxidoreductase, partial [Rhizobiales bacterium]|nr:FAD-dependent oxidoreductase [Hyphomicrobiales bacterium]
NYGCVPSKALIAAGKAAYAQSHSAKFGVAPVTPKVDFEQVHRHIHGVIASIEPLDSQERFEGLGVRVIREAGRFRNAKTLVVGSEEITARRFVVATGSSPGAPAIPGLDQVPYLTNETVFNNTSLPKELIIIGGGPIGMELAQAHARLGSNVTVLEAFTPLGKDDPELTKFVLNQVIEDGVRILSGIKINSVAHSKEGYVLDCEYRGKPHTVTGTTLLVAAGRTPNVDGLDLERAGIEYSKRGIKVDKSMRTTNKKVYAIGDVAGGLQFTHMANYHAGLVMRSALFPLPVKESTAHIPWVTYTDPELANIGLSEEQAKEQHDEIRVLRWPFAENDRAQAERKAQGLVKVIVTPKGRILGAAIVGPNAGELIHVWSLAVSSGLNIRAFTGYVVPYPTLGEVSKRAAITHFSGLASNKWVQLAMRVREWLG